MYRSLFHSAISGKVIAVNGKIVDSNESSAMELGYPSAAAMFSLALSDISFDGLPPPTEWVDDMVHPFHEWKMKRYDGSALAVYAQFTHAVIEDQVHLCIHWHKRDVWEKLEEQSVFQGAILRAVIDADKNLIYSKNYCDGDGVYIGCNRAFKEFYGLKKEMIIGRNDLEIFGRRQGSAFRERDAHVIENRQDNVCEEWVEMRDGRKVLLHTDKTILKDDEGHIIGLLSISRDITDEHQHVVELEESEKAYKEMANTDPLTGIPNRRLFFVLSREHFDRTSAHQQPLSLAMIDVDDFKKINDTYGHVMGDKVLKHIVEQFQRRLRDSDLLARYAGDEFAILLPNTNAVSAHNVATALQTIIQTTPFITVSGEKIYVTISVGVSEHGNEDVCEELLQNADKALYLAKELGGNRVEVYASSK